MRARVLVLALAAAACGSPGAERTAPPPAAGDADAGRVSIPADVTARLDAWMAEEMTLLGDVVEIRATRIPFTANLAVESSRETDSAGRRIVERTESRDPETGLAVLTLTNRSGFTTTIDTLPRVRLGGGRQFIATDRLVYRQVPPAGTDRPVHFAATATGRARLVGSGPRVAGERIVVRAGVERGAAGYEFRSDAGP